MQRPDRPPPPPPPPPPLPPRAPPPPPPHPGPPPRRNPRHLPRPVGGAVVHHHQPEGPRVVLRQQAPHRLADRLRLVPRRHHGGHGGPGRRGRPGGPRPAGAPRGE